MLMMKESYKLLHCLGLEMDILLQGALMEMLEFSLLQLHIQNQFFFFLM